MNTIIKKWKELLLLLILFILATAMWNFWLTDTVNFQQVRLTMNATEDDKPRSGGVTATSMGTEVQIFEAVPRFYYVLCSHLNRVFSIEIHNGELFQSDYKLINRQRPEKLMLFNVQTSNVNMNYWDWSMLFNQDDKFLDSQFHCFTQLFGNTSITYLHLDSCPLDVYTAMTIESMANINQLYISGSINSNEFKLKDFIPRLQKLSRLTCIQLCNMNLTQQDLNQIAQLKEIETLDLSGSTVEGDLQSCVHNLAKLKRLCIINTRFSPETKLSFDNIEVIGGDCTATYLLPSDNNPSGDQE